MKKLDGLEESHPFASKYLYSLVNSGNFSQAYNFSKKLEKRKIDTIESNLVLGTHYLKNSQLTMQKNILIKQRGLQIDLYWIITLLIRFIFYLA